MTPCKLADSITVSLLLTGACDRIVKHSAQSDIAARRVPGLLHSRVARGFRTCTRVGNEFARRTINSQVHRWVSPSLALMRNDVRSTRTRRDGDSGCFVGKRGRFRNSNAMNGDIGTRRKERRERNVFRTGALLRYHRRAIAPSLPAFCLISSPT